MREIFIKYNPYRLETSITIDDAAPKQNSRLNFGDRRLQEWIEELPEILFVSGRIVLKRRCLRVTAPFFILRNAYV